MNSGEKYLKEVRPPELETIAVNRMISKKKVDAQDKINNKLTEDMLNKNKLIPTDLGLNSSKSRKQGTFFNNYQSELAMRNLKDNSKVLFYDIEATGTPQALRNIDSENFFGITEVAIKETSWDKQKKEFVSGNIEESFGIKIDKNSYSKMSKALDSLEENSNNYYNMNMDMRRSLKDIGAWGTGAEFGSYDFNGKKIPTLLSQAEGIKGTGPALFQPKTIKEMRLGLENNQKYGGELEDVFKIIGKYSKDNNGVTFAGQNNLNYDALALREVSKGIKNTGLTSIAKKELGKSQIDILTMVNNSTNSPFTDIGENMKLHTLASKFAPNAESGTLHYSGYDVSLTQQVANAIVKNDNSLSEVSQVQTGQEFLATKGFGAWGSKNEVRKGQFSGVFSKDNASGTYKSSREFQERALQQNKVYKLIGQYEGIVSDTLDMPMYGLEFLDVNTDKRHLVFNQNINSLNSLFDGNLIDANTKEAKERIANGQKDSARRRYDRLTSGTTDDFIPNAIDRLKGAYKDVSYIERAEQAFDKREDVIKEAVRLKNSENGLKEPFDASYQKMEGFFDLKGRLNQEKDFWNDVVIPRAEQEVNGKGYSPNRKILEQNKVVDAYKDALSNTVGNIETEYGYTGSKKLPMNTANGISYLDMENSSSINRQLTNINRKTNNPSQIRREMNGFLDQYGSSAGIPDHELLQYRTQIDKFLREDSKEIPRTFLDEISNKIYESADESNIVASIPGMDIKAADNTSIRGSYMNNLTSSRIGANQAHKEVVKTAENAIANKYGVHSNSLELENFFSNESVGKHMKTSVDVENKLKQNINYIKKGKQSNIEEKIQSLVTSFDNMGMGTAFVSDDKGISMFVGKERMNLERMSPLEMHKNKNLSKIRLPLYGEDGLIDINGASVVNMFELDTRGKGTLSTTQDKAFKEYSRIPKEFERRKKIALAYEGKVDESALMDEIISGMNNRIIGSQEVTSWRGDIADKKNTNSTARNYYNGTMIDTKSYENEWVKKNHPEAFSQYERYSRGDTSTSFFDSQFTLSKELGNKRDLKHQYSRNYQKDFNETYGKELGVKLSSFGNTNKHVMGNKSRAIDPRVLIPGGNYDPTYTETAVKSFNYFPQDKNYSIQKMKEMGFSDTEQRLTMQTTQTPFANNILNNEQTGFNASILYIDDAEIKNRVDSAVKSTDTSIQLKKTELNAELNKTGKSRNKQVIQSLSKEIEFLESKKIELSGFEKNSVFDGSMLISESKMKLFNKTEERSVKLQMDEVLSPELIEKLNSNPLVKEAIGGDFTGTQSFMLENPIPSEQFGLNKNNQLTVGMLNKYETIEGVPTSSLVAGTKTKFHQKNWGIKGLEIDGKSGELKLITEHSQDVLGKGGNKFLIGAHGRTVGHPAKDSIMNELFDGADILMPRMKAGKESGTDLIMGTINTIKADSLKALEQASVGNNNSPMIVDFLKKNPQITMGDLNKEEIQSQFLNTTFKDNLDVIGLKDFFSTEGNTTRALIPHNIENEKLMGREGLQNLGKFTNSMSKGLGFEDSGLLTHTVGLHDVYDWSGTTTKLKTGEKLNNIIGNKYGKNSVIYDHYLSNKGENSKRYWDAGMDILNSNEQMAGGILSPSKNNIVFDLASSFSSSPEGNISIGSNGEMIVALDDLKNMPDYKHVKGTKATMLDYKGTALDIKNVKIRDGKETYTVGDLLKEDINKSTWGKLPKVQGMEHEYFPLIDMKISGMNDEESAIFDKMVSTQKDIFSDSYKLQQTAQNGILSVEENLAYKSRLVENINKNVAFQKQEMASFMTGTSGGFMEHIQKKEMPNSGAYKSSTSNIYNQYERVSGEIGNAVWENKGKFKDGTTYMNPENFKSLLTPEVLPQMADELGISYDITMGGVMTKEMQSSVKEQIVDQLDINSGNKSLYGETLRFPVNQKQTVLTQKIQLSNDIMKNEIKVGLGSASNQMMDFDGDMAFVNLSTYGLKGQERKDAFRLQEREWNREQSGILEAASKEMNKQELGYQRELYSDKMYKAKTSYQESIGSGYLSEDEWANKIGEKEYIKIQEQMVSQSQSEIIAGNVKPIDTGKGIHSYYNNEEIDRLLSPKTSSVHGIQSLEASLNASNIGPLDNMRQKYNTDYQLLQEAGLRSGKINKSQMDINTTAFEKFTSDISQAPISSKKLALDALSDSSDIGPEALMERVMQRQKALDSIPYAVGKIGYDEDGALVGVEKLKQHMIQGGIYDEETFEKGVKGFAQVNRGSEILGDSKMFASSGTKDLTKVTDFVSGESSSLQKVQILERMRLDNAKSSGEPDLLADKVLSNLSTIEKTKNDRLVDVFEEVNTRKVKDIISETPIMEKLEKSKGIRESLSDGVDLLTDQRKKRIASIHNTPENLISGIKNLGEKALNSDAMAMGGMFVGAWAVSALMRRSPTPEGDLAQQEATQAQVNPSALLTSPTARVTNNNEMVTLNVQATGNSDMNHEAVAGLISQQVGQMTGSPMEMNINVTDNISKLDQQWYNKKIGNVFGIN